MIRHLLSARYTTFSIFLFLSASTCSSHAFTPINDVCVTTIAELQTALTNAQVSTEPTLIKVTAGTYEITSTLTYTSTSSSGELEIQGGYGPIFGTPCGIQEPDPTQTILDGLQSQQIMDLTRLNDAPIVIKSLTFQHGLSASVETGIGVAALFVENRTPDHFSVDVENNVFARNANAMTGNGAIVDISTSGDLHFINNVVVDNALNEGQAVSIVPLGGSAAINNNTVSGNTCVTSSVQPAVIFYALTPTTVVNNVFSANPDCAFDVEFTGNADFTIASNDFGNSHVNLSGGTVTGSGNMFVAPGFVGSGSYQLSPDSLLIDAGLNSPSGGVGIADAAGHPRVVAIRSPSAIVDIGAYELQDRIFADSFE